MDGKPARRESEERARGVFITDQERAIQHFPLGPSRQDLPGLTQLSARRLAAITPDRYPALFDAAPSWPPEILLT